MKISHSIWRWLSPIAFLLILAGCLAHPEQSALPDASPLSVMNPGGDEVLTAFAVDSGTRLVRSSPTSGAVFGEIVFPGRCEALLARPGEWLIFVTTLETFSFGGNLRSRLLRWDGLQPPREFPLNDTTLDRATLLDKERLAGTLQPHLSPYGDEILLLRLHDPPAFDPYLEIVLYHLDSQQVHSVAKVPGLYAVAEYRAHGDLVAWSDGRAPLKIVDPWSQEEFLSYNWPKITAKSEKILLLRKWRAMGLITAPEYAVKIREGQE